MQKILVLVCEDSLCPRKQPDLSGPGLREAGRYNWASLVVENLVELVLWFVALLTTRGAIHSADCIVRLTLARRIPLVARPSTIVVALPIVVVVATREAAAFLLFFVRPVLHHVS